MPPDPVVLEDPIDMTGSPEPRTGLEPAPDDTPQIDFDKVNDEAPNDAEPFVAPEEAPKNDDVPE